MSLMSGVNIERMHLRRHKMTQQTMGNTCVRTTDVTFEQAHNRDPDRLR